VARVAGLLAVAGLPGLAGIGAGEFGDAEAFTDGFHTALTMTGGLAILAGGVAFLTLTGDPQARHDACPPASSCPLEAPPLRVGVTDVTGESHA
jgi:hypothetical protein